MMQSTHFIYSYTASEGWTTEPKTLESGLKNATSHPDTHIACLDALSQT